MYIEFADRAHRSMYLNSDHIKCIQFNDSLCEVGVWMTDGEHLTIDYTPLFPYPARKINYRACVKLKQLVGFSLEESSISEQ